MNDSDPPITPHDTAADMAEAGPASGDSPSAELPVPASPGEVIHYFMPRVEALLFVAESPLQDEDLVRVLPGLLEPGVEAVMQALEARYRDGDHALTVQRVGGGWRLATHADHAELVRAHLKGRLRGRLSRASLETVSIIAYRPKISRPEIEQLRGVDSSATLRHLLDRGLIRVEEKRAESPGRPLRYSTTQAFLTYFDLDSLADLPDPGEVLAEPDEAQRGSEVQRGPFAGTDSGVERETYRAEGSSVDPERSATDRDAEQPVDTDGNDQGR